MNDASTPADVRPVADRMVDWEPPVVPPPRPDRRWAVFMAIALVVGALAGFALRATAPDPDRWCSETVAVLTSGEEPLDQAGTLPSTRRSLADTELEDARVALRSAARRVLVEGSGSMWEADLELAADRVIDLCGRRASAVGTPVPPTPPGR